MSQPAFPNEHTSPSNRLAREKSPYLLQHAHNPVDWYAWSPEAFKKAKDENKPILLSIGYSTCHWCHVMERESFEDAKTAELMNRHYVSVKVDREERPDIDSVYMSYVTATTGHGGWPMTVFLTPDQKPFYGGTYFPPEDRYGMPGFKTLLVSIADAWRTREDEIKRSADSAVVFLRDAGAAGTGKAAPDAAVFEKAYGYYEQTFDAEHGGFGGAPKFPRSHALSFLLRYWKRTGSENALAMVRSTLGAMLDGGIYDQLGGGFHRYSTDKLWRIPHFEKMLYDQALLALTYSEAYQVTRDPEYARAVRQTLDYVLGGMTSSQGGFYSAEDADSADPDHAGEKREGAFFIWKITEIEKLLPERDAKIFIHAYGIESAGNAVSDPHKEFEGKNALYRAKTSEEAAAFFQVSVPEIERSLVSSRKTLMKARALRPKPHLDDKILADWNGLMITALARASRVLNEPQYSDAALRAAGFISGRLTQPDGRLLHRFRDGEAAIDGSLNDYAFMLQAYLELYEAVFDEKWLLLAEKTASRMTALFADAEAGGFYLTAHDAEALITRPKEVYDGAVPSGNSVAALGLLRLGRMTGDARREAQGRGVLEAFSRALADSPANFTQMLIALDFAAGPSSEIVIAAGKPDGAEAQKFLEIINRRFVPGRVVLWNASAEKSVSVLLKDKGLIDGKAAVYVCRDYACQLPATDPKKLEELLDH